MFTIYHNNILLHIVCNDIPTKCLLMEIIIGLHLFVHHSLLLVNYTKSMCVHNAKKSSAFILSIHCIGFLSPQQANTTLTQKEMF